MSRSDREGGERLRRPAATGSVRRGAWQGAAAAVGILAWAALGEPAWAGEGDACGGEDPVLFVAERSESAKANEEAGRSAEAMREARSAVACDGGANSFRSRQVIIRLLVSAGRYDEARMEVAGYLGVAGLTDDQVAWGKRMQREIPKPVAGSRAGRGDPGAPAGPAVGPRVGAPSRRVAGAALVVGGGAALVLGAVALGEAGVCDARGYSVDECSFGWLSRGVPTLGVGVAVELVGVALLAGQGSGGRAARQPRVLPAVAVGPAAGGVIASVGAVGRW